MLTKAFEELSPEEQDLSLHAQIEEMREIQRKERGPVFLSATNVPQPEGTDPVDWSGMQQVTEEIGQGTTPYLTALSSVAGEVQVFNALQDYVHVQASAEGSASSEPNPSAQRNAYTLALSNALNMQLRSEYTALVEKLQDMSLSESERQDVQCQLDMQYYHILGRQFPQGLPGGQDIAEVAADAARTAAELHEV